MKRSSLLLIAITLSLNTIAQTIRIADKNLNRPAGANIYPTLQAAIDAAVPGDIVYITPVLSSEGNYGNVIIGKRLTLQGAYIGSRFSYVNQITFIPSSDGFTSVSNSVFNDIYVNYFTFSAGGLGSFTFDDIVFDNCGAYNFSSNGNHPTINRLTIKNGGFAAVSLTTTSGVNDLKIYNNVFSTDPYTKPITLANATNVVISNNLIYSYGGNYTVDIQNSSSVLIANNIFSGSGQAFQFLSNTNVINNIFFGQTPGCVNTSHTFGNNTFSNNVVATVGFVMPPAANGGLVNSGINNLPSGTNPLFVSAAQGTVHSAAYDYTLSASSPCIGAGSGGDNIGPSGGLYPFTSNIIHRDSSVPVITQFDNNGMVPQNQPLKSNIKAKSN